MSGNLLSGLSGGPRLMAVAVQIIFVTAVQWTQGAESPPPPSTPDVAPLYFSSPDQAVRVAGLLLANHDWVKLSRYYDLSLTPQISRGVLLDGSFFLDAAASRSGPAAVARWRQPFAPGAKLVEARALGDAASLPCVWSLTTVLEIDQGGGSVQRVVRDCRLIQTGAGFRFLPPAPTETTRTPSSAPVASESEQARGAELVLVFRPELRTRVANEVPAGRAANIPALVQVTARLKSTMAAHPGHAQPAARPWEPALIYNPTDEELLLSLAGDRIWRSLQLAPPGTLTKVRADNPGFVTESIEYPHIEIVRADAAGSGPQLYALPPVMRRLNLRESLP